MSYPGYRQQLQNDPARSGKGAWLTGGNPSYPSQVANFNNWLYTPLDRRAAQPPGTPAPTTAHTDAYSTGWQAPSQANLADIQTRYSGASTPSTPWTQPLMSGPPTRTATTSPTTPQPAAPTGSILDTAPLASINGAVSPAQNSMQRWQASAQQPGLKPLSDARRFFWATGNIDARAPQSPQNSTPAPVTFQGGNGHSSWTPDSGTNTSPAPVSFANAGTGGHSNWEPGY